MIYTPWSIENRDYEEEKLRSRESLFCISNGYFGIRGFFEEENEGIGALGGIYVAAVLGLGANKAWTGNNKELVNQPNFLRLRLAVNGHSLKNDSQSSSFSQKIDMKNAVYTRSFIYEGDKGEKVEFTFSRFVSLKNKQIAGQRFTVKNLGEKADFSISSLIDENVTNLNLVSCEPLPIQPGRNHIKTKEYNNGVHTYLYDAVEGINAHISQYITAFVNGEKVEGEEINEENNTGERFDFSLEKGEEFRLEKLVTHYSNFYVDNGEELAREFLTSCEKGEISFDEELRLHKEEWAKKWEVADIVIEGNGDDQTAVRFNIFHLISVCPENTDRVSIGARGLTGEMYNGCVFWDNEVFKVPFFTFTNPAAARKLLAFRHNTLDAAREHAANNHFKGAMYPWEGDVFGTEQTPINGGAFYAIHIVSDIAFAIKQYWETTGDDGFIIEHGAEVLFETARFWVSRKTYDERTDSYNILAVRGPNEYDVTVNNNAYTNIMAIENIKTALLAIEKLGDKLLPLMKKLGIEENELTEWKDAANKIKIPYNEKHDLYEEDDMYLYRMPLDMSKAKPDGKRIVETGYIAGESFMLYQFTKQADVIMLMDLLPHMFTKKQMENAYNYYEPRTAHDSSLSYAPHGMLAAKIGYKDEAYRYFEKSAFLDVNDLQLNTVSGLHFANFGGTWQLTYFGFGGVSQDNKTLFIEPQLPEAWKKMSYHVNFLGGLFKVMVGEGVSVEVLALDSPVKLKICGKDFTASASGEVFKVQ